jgi:Tfp pilus assembly protein PilX
MTLLALAASHVTKTQTRVATASQEQDQAFQHAEAALRAGEQVVLSLSSANARPCETAPCRIYPPGALAQADIANADLSWWEHHTERLAAKDAVTTQASKGRFVIEKIDEVRDSLAIDPDGQAAATHYFRVSAVGMSDSGSPRVVLQSVVALRASL